MIPIKNIVPKLNVLFSDFRIPHLLVIALVSIIANHLMENDNFPMSESYDFPLLKITSSILIGILIFMLTNYNFKYYKKNYFMEQINSKALRRFLLSTLGYITILYIPSYYITLEFANQGSDLYHLFIGLLLTLMLSCIIILPMFAKDIYDLYKLKPIQGKLIIRKGAKINIIDCTNIAYFLSKDKIVSVIEVDGTSRVTDFTLSEMESKVNDHLFFRANRQTLIHARSILEIKTITNGKLSVTLTPLIFGQEAVQIVISRYKKQAFMAWFQKRL